MSAAALSSSVPPTTSASGSSSPLVSSVAPAPSGGSTVISCYHPVVAQKSYGEEKRFLCPPPFLSVSAPSHKGSSLDAPLLPTWSSFSAVVVTDDGSVAPTAADQHVTHLDETGKACFKSLHVTSASRSKSFRLKIKAAADAVTITSRPIAIVSKPSKKTLKGGKGGDASSITSGSLVSFYNRVNSQTVRTKFLGNEQGQLSAKNSSWSPFTIDVVENGRIKVFDSPTPILYGQEVILRDLETGFCSEVLLIQKADKSSPESIEGSPVTHLQKVTLQSKVRPGHFLTVSQALFGSSDPLLILQRPTKGPEAAPEDLMCWSIVGIEKTTVSV